MVRAYAACGKPPSVHAPPPANARGAVGVVVVNLHNNTSSSPPVQLALPTTATGASAWTLSPPAGGVFGRGALLNGVPLPGNFSDGDGVPIGAIPVPAVTIGKKGMLPLPPASVTFLTINGIVGVPSACKA